MFLLRWSPPALEKTLCLPCVVDCMFPLPNLYTDTLKPSVTVFGDEPFGRQLGHKGRALMIGLVPLQEKDKGACLSLFSPPCKDTARTKLTLSRI